MPHVLVHGAVSQAKYRFVTSAQPDLARHCSMQGQCTLLSMPFALPHWPSQSPRSCGLQPGALD
jgi:hypothetical protein